MGSRSTSMVTSHIDTMYPWYDVMRMVLDLHGLLPITLISQIPTEGHSIKYLTSNPQNWQGHQKNKENLRNCQYQEEAKDT